MDALVELEGTITQHEYRNPHVYLVLEATTASGETQEWLLEANSVSTLRRAGWNADAFVPGDRVKVSGNLDRDSDKRLLFVDVITKSDGAAYQSAGLPPGANDAPAAARAGSWSWIPSTSARRFGVWGGPLRAARRNT